MRRYAMLVSAVVMLVACDDTGPSPTAASNAHDTVPAGTSDLTLDAASFGDRCNVDTDCTDVRTQPCACSCAESGIAKSAEGAFLTAYRAAASQCPDVAKACALGCEPPTNTCNPTTHTCETR